MSLSGWQRVTKRACRVSLFDGAFAQIHTHNLVTLVMADGSGEDVETESVETKLCKECNEAIDEQSNHCFQVKHEDILQEYILRFQGGIQTPNFGAL